MARNTRENDAKKRKWVSQPSGHMVGYDKRSKGGGGKERKGRVEVNWMESMEMDDDE